MSIEVTKNMIVNLYKDYTNKLIEIKEQKLDVPNLELFLPLGKFSFSSNLYERRTDTFVVFLTHENKMEFVHNGIVYHNLKLEILLHFSLYGKLIKITPRSRFRKKRDESYPTNSAVETSNNSLMYAVKNQAQEYIEQNANNLYLNAVIDTLNIQTNINFVIECLMGFEKENNRNEY